MQEEEHLLANTQSIHVSFTLEASTSVETSADTATPVSYYITGIAFSKQNLGG